jgi:serine/threonine-protein phosphatase 2A regulatory subunit B'
MLKDFLKPRYLQELIQLMDTDEYDERDFLKNIIHKLYEKVVQRRK